MANEYETYNGSGGDNGNSIPAYKSDKAPFGEQGGILERLRKVVDVDLKRVEDAAETAGAPWTSGRIPTWKP